MSWGYYPSLWGTVSRKYKRVTQPFSPNTACAGLAEALPGWGSCGGDGDGGEAWSPLLAAALTHRRGGLVDGRLENHHEELLLVVLAGGQETVPALLKKGAGRWAPRA